MTNEQQIRAMDKNATIAVVKQNPEVTKLEEILYYMQNAKVESEVKNKFITRRCCTV